MSGIPSSQCARCLEEAERAPLPADPLRSKPDGTPVLILRTSSVPIAKALTPHGLSDIEISELQSEADSWGYANIRSLLSEVAQHRGFLFVPKYPLTTREQLSDVGPSHCYHCRSLLSLETGSLGCSACRYYVCTCGRCLCGYTGRNWKGELFSQFPPLPIAREQRLEYLRAFRFLGATEA
jgi:hypothetical protein